jgi:hypothetical protein
VTRGKEQAQIFTDDRNELLKAISRPDDPMTATELAGFAQPNSASPNGRMKRLALARVDKRRGSMPPSVAKDRMADRGLDHEQ